MTTWLNRLLFGLLLIVGVPYYWLFLDNRPGDAEAKPVSIAQLRQIALGQPGPLPGRIEYELIARRSQQRNLVAAGTGLRNMQQYVFAYYVDIPGRAPVIIDTGLTEKQAEKLGFKRHDLEAQARVDAALKQAATIIVQADRAPHIGGLTDLLARAQDAARDSEPADTSETNRASQPFAVAPGIVVVPVSGLRDKSSLVFVKLETGEEFLFVGAVSPSDLNWRGIRAPARLMTDYLAPENRDEIFSWLRTIDKLKREDPGLHVISLYKLPADAPLYGTFPERNEK